ncbi:MAG TPA: class I SAM-dependent methyltransferase [Candidatus Eisenbacteria bacterium]|nr:class I SAM-dependent methyltransferase [Candidatus Eisenbacteria bacterium]
MALTTVPGLSQCQKPRGWLGRFVLCSMNARHAGVTDWGLRHVSIAATDTVLDVGCGGGRTLAKLARAASQGSAHGIDYSTESVHAARRLNREAIARGQVTVQEASVSAMPFAEGSFDLVTAVETHFWWQDPDAGMREIGRILKPGGRLVVIAEFYNGGKHAKWADRISQVTTMAVWNVEQHKALFTRAGFVDVQVDEERRQGWICVVGTKPRAS